MADYYKKESDGLLHLYHYDEEKKADEHVHASADVAVAYVIIGSRVHLFTHGTPEGMKAWQAAHNSVCPEEHRASLKSFSDPAVLNKLITEPPDARGHFSYLASLI